MLRILICDDDENFAQGLGKQIRKHLQSRELPAQIHIYASAENIPGETLARCDIAFLDVDFSGKAYTGMDIARALREKAQNAVILFVTNFPEYAPEGYEVQAFRYLLKSAVPAKLESYLEQALAQLRSVSRTVTLTLGSESIRIPVEDVLYFEAQLREVLMHSAGGAPSRLNASIGTLEELLAEEGFLRIHKSYLVNMRHLKKLQCHEAELTGGVPLRVSERNYAQLKRQYLLWKGK